MPGIETEALQVGTVISQATELIRVEMTLERAEVVTVSLVAKEVG